MLKCVEDPDTLHQICGLAGAVMGETVTDVLALRRLYIDIACSISIVVHKKKYFLFIRIRTLAQVVTGW